MSSKLVENRDVTSHDDSKEQTNEFVEPKLTFLKPELQKQGSLENLTKQGFFGTFPGTGS